MSVEVDIRDFVSAKKGDRFMFYRQAGFRHAYLTVAEVVKETPTRVDLAAEGRVIGTYRRADARLVGKPYGGSRFYQYDEKLLAASAKERERNNMRYELDKLKWEDVPDELIERFHGWLKDYLPKAGG